MIDDRRRAQLQRYLDELYRFNERINLTTVPVDQAWQRHILESEALLTVLHPVREARVVDIGSGAGVPGIPLAILDDGLDITLVESDARRCGFLVHVSGLLGLRTVAVVQRRAEDYAHDPSARESFDHAVSRASAPPVALCELALPMVRVGGTVAMLVADAESVARRCREASRQCGGGAPRTAGDSVVVIDKQRPSPSAFPRRSGVPARRPLVH